MLITGETGTGKGLVARLLHRVGPRAGGPFVDVNCAAIPETLLESELFGYERGAFTEARQAKPGLFQTAHRGAIFLDEIGLLSEALQAKLLKVLEDRAVRRLGATRSEPVDAWIISATNADLDGRDARAPLPRGRVSPALGGHAGPAPAPGTRRRRHHPGRALSRAGLPRVRSARRAPWRPTRGGGSSTTRGRATSGSSRT